MGLLLPGILSSGNARANLNKLLSKANDYHKMLVYDSSEYYYGKVLQQFKPEQAPELYCNIANKYAESLWWQLKLNEAGPVCRKNLELCENLLGKLHPETAKAHLNLGAFKMLAGGYGVTTEHFMEARYIYEDLYGYYHPGVAKATEWLGTYYEGVADTIKSRKYLWEAFHIWKKIKGPDHPDLGDIYRYMGLYCKRFFKHDSAIILFRKAKSLFDQKYGPANMQSVKCLNNMADIYAEHPEMDHMTMPTYHHCDSLIKAMPSPSVMAQVMNLFNIGEYAGLQGDIETALAYMNEVLKLFYPDFKDTSIFANPADARQFAHHYSKLIFNYKGNYFEMLANKHIDDRDKMIACKKGAYAAFMKSEVIIEEMRKRSDNPDDLLTFSRRHSYRYYIKARLSAELYELTGDKAYINGALRHLAGNTYAQHAMKSKQILLQTFDIPEEIITKRDEYHRRINQLTGQLNKKPDEKLKRAITELELELDAYYWKQADKGLISFHPADSSTRITLENLQKAIDHDESLLIFSDFIPDNSSLPVELMIMGVTSNNLVIERIPYDTLLDPINNFYKKISSQQQPAGYLKDGFFLYTNMIKPFEDILKERIILIHSPWISKIPFEALPLSYDSLNRNPDLLIGEHLVWRYFSLYDFMDQFKQPRITYATDSILAVAPAFNEQKKAEIAHLAKRDISLVNLVGAIKECLKVAELVKTRLVRGFEATESLFKALCARYPIIHISTHAIPHQSDSQTMQLAFSPETGIEDDGYLNFYEIMNLELNADLVVLSACKTAIGKLHSGEGSLNLAWAFNQAGARSAIVSLWDVNDHAASLIMPEFYKYLKEGHTKPEALRMAKLNYLETTDDVTSNPYFWAPFEYIGPDNSLELNAKTGIKGNWYTITFAVLILIIASLVAYRMIFRK